MRKVLMFIPMVFISVTAAIVYASKAMEFGYHPVESRVSLDKKSQIPGKERNGFSLSNHHEVVVREDQPPEIRGVKTQAAKVLHPDKLDVPTK